MTIYLLDTNVVSNAVHRRSDAVAKRLLDLDTNQLKVSSITYGEVQRGLAQRPDSKRLAEAIADFFVEIEVLSWTDLTAQTYGRLRAVMRKLGKTLEPLDMLIAAHALEAGAVLVSSDSAFRHFPGLTVEDWTAA
ncbi:type II toxin-antitoxin system VapC family toxin [Mesorhizobium australicum]|uniref:Ribonuclease VapC n=1 Tax=Mesorhizobium australicum TaxID=536018 RepID=A0A1X7PN49_9HYPH|nr:type II toxin-antitoxin system VapC family toxin [Mesorhizobium australicum]SMH53339.1 tRNA(fMet)-specific endonuclease VapC [Mesorhizobium australicum]